MKIILLLIVLAMTNGNSFAQVSTDSVQPNIKADYLQKSKNQKMAAVVLLGVGAALDIGGIISSISNANKELNHVLDGYKVNHSTEYTLYICGTASLLGSLSLFIVSRINKKKATPLTIDTQPFRQMKTGNMYTLNYPALTLKVRL